MTNHKYAQPVLYIGNLPENTNERELEHLLKSYGHITHLRFAKNRETGKNLDFVFVKIHPTENTQRAALDLNNHLFKEHFLITKVVEEGQ